MKEALAAGNTQLASKIAADISSNDEKINLHGKRADAIVKNMLQHSRISNGKKELTDLNVLVYEYLRLPIMDFGQKTNRSMQVYDAF
jgi:hypothetical protein